MLESEDYSTELGGDLGHRQHSMHVIPRVSTLDRSTVFTNFLWCTEKLVRSRYLHVQPTMASASGLEISPGVKDFFAADRSMIPMFQRHPASCCLVICYCVMTSHVGLLLRYANLNGTPYQSFDSDIDERGLGRRIGWSLRWGS